MTESEPIFCHIKNPTSTETRRLLLRCLGRINRQKFLGNPPGVLQLKEFNHRKNETGQVEGLAVFVFVPKDPTWVVADSRKVHTITPAESYGLADLHELEPLLEVIEPETD